MTARKRKHKEMQTPLGREYTRLQSISTEEPGLDTFQASRTLPVEELAVWTSSVGESKHPIGPPRSQPNPIVMGDLVVVSTYSPGAMLAFERDNGTCRWSLPLSYYGNIVTPGPPDSGLIYGDTSRELIAVEAATGRVKWSFCPYGRKGETIYSSPVVAGNRLFVGDRHGHLHCLAADTGESVWKVLTSRAHNNDVNSIPLIDGGIVVVGTNAKLAAGFDMATGQEVWRQRLDGPCIHTVPAGRGTALLWTSGSAYLLSMASGAVLMRWHRRNYCIDQACTAADLTLYVSRRAWGKDRLPWPVAELRCYRGSTHIYSSVYPRWSGTTIRYEPETSRVYEANAYGIGILNPQTGEREFVISFADREGHHGRVLQPSVLEGWLYAVGEDGRVFAIKHP